MKNIIKLASIVLVFSFTLFGLTNKASAAKLTMYCSVEIDVCEMLEQAYEKATGTKVAMTRASSGETFAKIKAESSNPKGDVWFGGTGDPHLTAAQENLTAEYKSSHFNGYINVEGDVQHKASSGSGVTVYKLWQQNGGYTGDIDIVCTASGWKTFIYDLVVMGHGGGGNWRGFAYHNGGITHGYQSVNNNNGGVGAMSLTTSGESMTF